jgi:hypothetical protein
MGAGRWWEAERTEAIDDRLVPQEEPAGVAIAVRRGQP